MKYNDLNLKYCPFCGAELGPNLFCLHCGQSAQILKETGQENSKLIEQLSWNNISDVQKAAIIELLSDMVFVEGGRFVMGTSEGDTDKFQRKHMVELSDFYISKFLVTQRQWQLFMGLNNCKCIGSELPVDSISWLDAVAFCKKLEELSGISFQLPTEAQWMFAAMERNEYNSHKYCGTDNLEECAWTKSNSNGHSKRPGLKCPNSLGIYDMSGNISEHCLDRWGEWPSYAIKNPYCPICNGGGNMVRKGGSYIYDKYDHFSSSYEINSRDCRSETSKMSDSGIRLAIYDPSTLNSF